MFFRLWQVDKSTKKFLLHILHLSFALKNGLNSEKAHQPTREQMIFDELFCLRIPLLSFQWTEWESDSFIELLLESEKIIRFYVLVIFWGES